MLHRATVTRVTTEGAYVEVPAMGSGVEFGPCDVLLPPLARSAVGGYATVFTQPDSDLNAAETSVSERMLSDPQGGSIGQAPHRHALYTGVAYLRPGDRVMVSDVDGIPENLVVLGRLA